MRAGREDGRLGAALGRAKVTDGGSFRPVAALDEAAPR
jgi:hypothetical protein